jgi:hypothetical protein
MRWSRMVVLKRVFAVSCVGLSSRYFFHEDGRNALDGGREDRILKF